MRFCGRLAIHEIFILEISLPKIWLASIGEQDTWLRLILARDDSKFWLALPAAAVEPGSLKPRSGRVNCHTFQSVLYACPQLASRGLAMQDYKPHYGLYIPGLIYQTQTMLLV